MSRRVQRRIARFAGSLAGQMALMLAIGMAASAAVALFALRTINNFSHDELVQARVLESAVDISGRLDSDPADTERLLSHGAILGATAAEPSWAMHPDPALSALLAERIGAETAPAVMRLGARQCFAWFNYDLRAAGMENDPLPDCWFVTFRDHTGARRAFSVHLLPDHEIHPPGLAPLYIALIALSSGLLGVLAARLATGPLRRMEKAARAFSLVADAEPMPVQGPSEVRAALSTFNTMQARVREALRERTQILAAVAHDLQTPLTRLRLRLEQVEDEALRARLVADLSATLGLVREGLDLARSSEAHEPWSLLDIDSILESIAEDAVELGADVRFTGGCTAHARVKPNALARSLDNLVSNAMKYAGSAELSCVRIRRDLLIRFADRGPGLPPEQIELAFQPFRRLGTVAVGAMPAGGSGIGLTIARAQAATFGAELTLANREGGGLVATIRIPGDNVT